MNTKRTCPKCGTSFLAVADYCICPECNCRFFASDPARPLKHELPSHIAFHATDVDSTEEAGVLNIWFGDEQESYLAFQRVCDGHEEEYGDLGGVYTEVNDQINSCVEGYSSVVLTPKSITVEFKTKTVMNGLVSVVAEFDIGDGFVDFAVRFSDLMRDKDAFRLVVE